MQMLPMTFTPVEFFHLVALAWLGWIFYRVRWSGAFVWLMHTLVVFSFALAAVVVALDYVGK